MAAIKMMDFEDIYASVLEEIGEQTSNTNALNKVKRYVNAIYVDEVVPFKDWKWLRKTTNVIHKASYEDGTVTVTPNSTTITLSTTPAAALGSFANYKFSATGFSEIYDISAHTAGSATVTLSSAFQGTLSTTATFRIWRDRFDLPTDCLRTFQVDHDRHQFEMQGKGLQELKKIMKDNPKAEGFPAYYHTTDFFDPTSGTSETESDRYRQVILYPSIHTTENVTIHVDYIQEVAELDADGDEPLMPIGDRIVLFYGAVSWAWRQIARNPEEADRRWADFQRKLERMSSELEDGFDMPAVSVNTRYLKRQRRGRLGALRRGYFPGGGGSSGGANTNITFAQDITINGAILSGTMTVNSGVSVIFSGLTAGSVLFLGSSKQITEDNTSLSFNDSTNTLTAANLTVTSAATVGTTLAVTGAVTFSNTLSVAGASTLTGAVSAGSTLGVTGAVTFSSTLSVTGAATFSAGVITKDSGFVINDASDATIQIDFNAAGTTGTKTTITGSQTANRVWTLPDATDTAVGKATTDTLTNKKLSDSTVSFVDEGDITKTLVFSLGGATTAKTMTFLSSHTDNRTLTFPDVTDTLMGKTTTDTMSNKTIASGIVTTALTFNATAEARFADTDNSNYVGFKAPGTVSANKIWTLPSADGSATQALLTDGAGVLSFGNQASSSKLLHNVGLTTSVGGSALTITFKQADGSTDCSATAPAIVGFRSATATNGGYTLVSVTGALSLQIGSGSTLGHASGVDHYIYVYVLNNAGTPELAASTTLYEDGSVVTTVEEGAAGAADSNRVIYSLTARANVPIRLIHRLKSNQTTAGTWATAIAEVSPMPFEMDDRIYAEIEYSANAHTSSGSYQDLGAGGAAVKANDTHNALTASTGGFVCPTTDIYEISGVVYFNANTTGVRGINVVHGATSYINTQISASSAADWACSFSTKVLATAGDTLKVQAYQNSGGNLGYGAGCRTTFMRVKK